MRRATIKEWRKVTANLRELQIVPHDLSGEVLARVNHGRWLADCPECGGAELVAEGTPFLCGTCGAKGGVVWPVQTEPIEAALEMRLAENQNWWPDETVTMLVAENQDHGL